MTRDIAITGLDHAAWFAAIAHVEVAGLVSVVVSFAAVRLGSTFFEHSGQGGFELRRTAVNCASSILKAEDPQGSGGSNPSASAPRPLAREILVGDDLRSQ